MARINRVERAPQVYTHQGGKAVRNLSPYDKLKRSILACFLWEDRFYESGQNHADRVRDLVGQVDPVEVLDLAIEARHEMHLRHAPLLLIASLLEHQQRIDPRHRVPISPTIVDIIQRVDEMGELIAIYWNLIGHNQAVGQSKKIPKQLQRGIRGAFGKFDAYQFGKYKGTRAAVSLKDVMCLVYPDPRDHKRMRPKGTGRTSESYWRDVYAKIRNGTLEAPDTWEVNLSAGGDKKRTFERLLMEKKLGYLALLRNLRNMEDAGVDRALVVNTILDADGADKVYPFRYVAAARAAPWFTDVLSRALRERPMEKLGGKTAILIDVSWSMFGANVSKKSDLTCADAAASLAIIAPCNVFDLEIYTFSNSLVHIKDVKRGDIASIDYIKGSQPNAQTQLWRSVLGLLRHHGGDKLDRLIVITDEQAGDNREAEFSERHKLPENAYMINVSSYEPSVANKGDWISITGFSENVFRYIAEIERFNKSFKTGEKYDG